VVPIVSTSPYTISALLYSVVMLYVFTLMLGVVVSMYLLVTNERHWWYALAGAAVLFLLLFVVQLMPIRIGTIMFLNGILVAFTGEYVVKIGGWLWRKHGSNRGG